VYFDAELHSCNDVFVELVVFLCVDKLSISSFNRTFALPFSKSATLYRYRVDTVFVILGGY
jgi:hypothetical protein